MSSKPAASCSKATTTRCAPTTACEKPISACDEQKTKTRETTNEQGIERQDIEWLDAPYRAVRRCRDRPRRRRTRANAGRSQGRADRAAVGHLHPPRPGHE